MLACLLVSLLLLATSCGGTASVASPYFAKLADLTLVKGRPAHVWVRVDTPQRLRITLLTERPVDSCTLAKVMDAGGDAIPVQPAPLDGSPHTKGGETAYALLTGGAVSPGTYRIEVAGTGLIKSLRVDERAAD